MFKWLTNIINRFRPKRKAGSKYDIVLRQIAHKKEELSKKEIKVPAIDWFKLSSSKLNKRKEIGIFQKYTFKWITTLHFLKEERISKEKERIAKIQNTIIDKLSEIDKCVKAEELNKAKCFLSEVETLKATIPSSNAIDSNISSRRQSIQQLSNTLHEREVERLRRIEEEKKRKEAEERRIREERERRERERREQLEREKRLKEQREYELRKKREEEARRKEEEARRKEEEKRNELERLTAPTRFLKNDKARIAQMFSQNGISYLYHFTDISNIKSIKEHGGLLSWYYCEQHNIEIPLAGGDMDSRDLDRHHGLEDYVRLSFCNDHPMAYHVKKRRGAHLVLLRIKVDVAFFRDTLFSDINAADSGHSRGSDATFIENNIRFSATKKHYVKNTDPDFKHHQAEVLVKTFIPLEYIENIDNPQHM